jgi:hypothetical protein
MSTSEIPDAESVNQFGDVRRQVRVVSNPSTTLPKASASGEVGARCPIRLEVCPTQLAQERADPG